MKHDEQIEELEILSVQQKTEEERRERSKQFWVCDTFLHKDN